MRMGQRSQYLGVAALALALVACDGLRPQAGLDVRPTRGYILISLDTLRADRLGSYGYKHPTSPYFDRLADRGALFEHALAPYPATLVSHMSMFTGLYPPQHAVYPPANVLPEGVWTLAEGMRRAGFRTQAHTEGGFVAGGYGFERGFEVYDDTAYSADGDIERTFGRGLEFLDALEPEERFFLFLHSYSTHDPYDPPLAFAQQFDGFEPPPDSSGERLRDFNFERIEIDPEVVERFSRRYDASVRYVDSVLEHFVTRLEASGLLAETTLVITSDHGEEFLEHGKLAHTQLYPESLAVPLLVVHPDLTQGRRVGDEVSLVDLAPTLAELAGLVPQDSLAGRSLVPYLGGSQPPEDRFSYAELDDLRYLRALVGEVDGVRYQLLVESGKPDDEGTWVAETIEFDAFGPQLALRSRSFDQPRRVVVRSNGQVVGTWEVTPDWEHFAVDLPATGLQRIELETSGCSRPVDLGESDDSRCLGVIMQGPPLIVARLFDLDQDPMAWVDVSRDLPLVTKRMVRELQGMQMTAVGSASHKALSEQERLELRDLGYLD